MPDVTGENTPNTLYVIPLDLEKEGMGKKLLDSLNLEQKKVPDWGLWKAAVERLINPSREIDIAIIGKYLKDGDYKLIDSYISINEAIKHASSKNDVKVRITWLDSRELENSETDVK